MKEGSPLFDDGQPWGEETEDGIVHNKVPYITINYSKLL
jgi:kinetochore protein NDC80